jgi:hypothetical protein
MRVAPRGASGLLLALTLATTAAAPAAKKPVDPQTWVERAERVRLPDTIFAVEVALRSFAPSGKSAERSATFSAVADGRGPALMVRHTPKLLQGGTALVEGDTVRTLAARGSAQAVAEDDGSLTLGELAGPALWRLDLARGFRAEDRGDETFDGTPCRKLELVRTGDEGVYRRAEYWIAKDGFLPQRIDYYGADPPRLLKRVRYVAFEKGPLGLRPSRIVAEGGNPWEETVEIKLSSYRKFDLLGLALTPATMAKVRAHARPQGNPKTGPDFVLEEAWKAAAVGGPAIDP